MKSRMLMAALVVVMLVGVRAYANDCGPCSQVDPCGACNGCAKSCDLFSGLKKLVACRPCAASECGPCDAVVACTPCDATACDPCGEVGCNDGCGSKFVFGSRLKHWFANKGCNAGCDPCGEVGCIDNGCDPCGEVGCDDGCGKSCFSFKKFFKGFKLRGCSCNDNGCGACDPACGACDNACGACDAACGDHCGACDPACGACDNACGACDAACGDGCGKKFGHIFDAPRRHMKKFFDGFRRSNCGPCDPCGTGSCDPCGHVACHGVSQLPEAAPCN